LVDYATPGLTAISNSKTLALLSHVPYIGTPIKITTLTLGLFVEINRGFSALVNGDKKVMEPLRNAIVATAKFAAAAEICQTRCRRWTPPCPQCKLIKIELIGNIKWCNRWNQFVNSQQIQITPILADDYVQKNCAMQINIDSTVRCIG